MHPSSMAHTPHHGPLRYYEKKKGAVDYLCMVKGSRPALNFFKRALHMGYKNLCLQAEWDNNQKPLRPLCSIKDSIRL